MISQYAHRVLNDECRIAKRDEWFRRMADLYSGTKNAYNDGYVFTLAGIVPRPAGSLLERQYAKAETLAAEFSALMAAMPLYNQSQQLEIEGHELASLRNWLLPMLMNGQLVVE